MKIRQAKEKARSLPRRVIVLRANFLEFPIPTARLRDAMTRIIPTIKAPRRKLKVAKSAIAWWLMHQFDADTRTGTPDPLPDPSRWPHILNSEHVSDELFENRAALQFKFTNIFELLGDDFANLMGDIPLLEERIVLLTVLDLWRLLGKPKQ